MMTFGQIMEHKRNRIPKHGQLIKDLEYEIAQYKQVWRKRKAIEKLIKEEIDFITSLQRQFKTGDKMAWNDGIQYSQHDLRNSINNLNAMLLFKSQIN